VSRKDKTLLRNLGGEVEAGVTDFFDGPDQAQSRVSVVLGERLLLAVLRSEVARLAADQAEATRFFSHIFDPTMSAADRAKFVAKFVAEPPTTVLSYPRTSAEFPCFAVVLDSETEVQPLLGDHVGETVEGEDEDEPAEYQGSIFEHVHAVYTYAEHPDIVAYLYQLSKLILLGAKPALMRSGLIDVSFAGGELSPEEMYLPDNMFARQLRVTSKSAQTVPRLLSPDPARVRLGGIFREDVVVDGIRGAVLTYDPDGDES
jgi:hypothetical protein